MSLVIRINPVVEDITEYGDRMTDDSIPPNRPKNQPLARTLTGDYLRIQNDVIRSHLATMTEAELKTYLALAMRADENTQQCHPGLGTIHHDTGLCRNAVIAAIRKLAQKGLIHKQRRHDPTGDWATNRYTLTDDWRGGVVHGDALGVVHGDALGVVHGDALGVVHPVVHKQDPYNKTQTTTGDGGEAARARADPPPLPPRVTRTLAQMGMTHQTIKLVSKHGPEWLECWLDYIEQQGETITSPAGFLVSKARANEPPPPRLFDLPPDETPEHERLWQRLCSKLPELKTLGVEPIRFDGRALFVTRCKPEDHDKAQRLYLSALIPMMAINPEWRRITSKPK